MSERTVKAILDMTALHDGSLGHAALRELAIEILLYHEQANWHTVDGTEATILYIYGDGYLGIVHRGKAHEGRVVASAVLRRARLTTHLIHGGVGRAAVPPSTEARIPATTHS